MVCLPLTLANCSSPKGGKDPKYGVAPSPRVVGVNEPAPKGGGVYMVGKPYKIAGKTYEPFEKSTSWKQQGLASWYGEAFHGRRTANGEVFDRNSVSAAHPTMPLPSYARVTNLKNGHSIIVRVNDRGPYHGNRVLDVSKRTAELLDFKRAGTGRIQVEYLGRASLAGSDDRKLAATLSTNPTMLAQLPETGASIAFASAQDRQQERQNAPAVTPVLAAAQTPIQVALAEPALPVDTTVDAVATPPTLSPLQQVPDQALSPQTSVPVPLERPLDLTTMPSASQPTSFVPVPEPAPLPALTGNSPVQQVASAPMPLLRR